MAALSPYPSWAIFWASICLLLPACASKTKLPPPAPGYHPCDIPLGKFSLQYPNSVLVMPYENKNRVVFTDSMGRLDTFQIRFGHKGRQAWTQYAYNGIVPGDTLKYCYQRQYYQCILESKASKVKFILDVAAMPRCLAEQQPCADAASKRGVDVLNIWCTDGNTGSRYSFLIFQKTMYPPTDYTIPGVQEWYPEKELLRRVFKGVARMDYLLQKPTAPAFKARLFYNTTEGIVAFSLNDGPPWRLQALEE